MPINYPADMVTAQSGLQQSPVTKAATATISVDSKMMFLTGTVQLANITPPDPAGYCEVTLCFTNAGPGLFLTNGTFFPLVTAYQPVQNRPIDLCYNPVTRNWWVKAVV